MATEIEYSNPTPISPGLWQVEMTRNAVSNASSNSPLSSIIEVERVITGGTLIVRVPDGESDSTKKGIRSAIENALPNATHVETRDVP